MSAEENLPDWVADHPSMTIICWMLLLQSEMAFLSAEGSIQMGQIQRMNGSRKEKS